MSDLKEIVRNIPHLSGIYKMKDKEDNIIYIGKAKDLHNRVSSYFSKNKDLKTYALVKNIANIDFIITNNEYEALLLENNLIKKYQPKYNINLKDGKSYPLIKITNEDFPKIIKTRKRKKDGGRYYGPFSDSTHVDIVLDFILSNFKIRRSSQKLKMRKTPCLYYHINMCSAPCCSYISKEEYAKEINEIINLLENKSDKLKGELTKKMNKASKALNYEKALSYKKQLDSLNIISKKQYVEDLSSLESYDYISLVQFMGELSICIIQTRDGKIMGNAIYRNKSIDDAKEILSQFILLYYQDEKTLPSTIFVDDKDIVELNDTFIKEIGVGVSEAKEKKHYSLLKLAQKNAINDIYKRVRSTDTQRGLDRLEEILELDHKVSIIEGFDIAHLSGKHTTASLINFKNGQANKKEYKHYNIKSLKEGDIDDYASIHEAVSRRYKRLRDEKKRMPDLILIDGGKGQVNAARSALDDLGLFDLFVIGLAKEYELIYVQDQSLPIELEPSDPALKILVNIRDECHRFATSFNQNKRTKEATTSILESIHGVGPKISKDLLVKFESIENIKKEDEESLSKKAKISKILARRILEVL